VEEEEPYQGKKKKKGTFWNLWKAMIVVGFIVGLVLGAYITHYHIEPALKGAKTSDYAKLQEYCDAQDTELDRCLMCLDIEGVDSSTCP